MTDAPVLSVRDLRVTIRARTGVVEAVAGISFAIGAGETLALVGESGSGKSMTAMSLIGLTPVGTTVQTAGQAMFGGVDLLTRSEAELRQIRGRQIAAVFQDPSASLDPLMSVATQIGEALPTSVRRNRAEADRSVAGLLAEVGLDSLPDIERRHPHELSGGQQQRVAIAMALAGNPSLLIADEPTTALDMTVQAQILQLLQRLQRARGMAMLLITHDLGIVANYARDVVVMRHGHAVEQGSVGDVLGSPREDYTRMLLDCRPRMTATADRVVASAGNGHGEPAAETPPSLLTVTDLVVSYPGRGMFARPVTAVAGVSLTIARGSALGIVGESGSGKSTIAKAIVGLSRIRSGTVCFNGAVLADPPSMTRGQRARLQYVFQDSYGALNPRLTVEQAIGEPFAITGMARDRRRAAVIDLLDEVGLARSHLGRLPRELSGGQRQRVNLARAIALSPTLMICDEIVSALDVSVQAQVLALLKQLQRDRDLTLMFISHDLAVIAEICDQVLVMHRGTIVEEGPVEAVFRQPAEAYTRSLIEAAAILEGVPGSGLVPPGVAAWSVPGPGLASAGSA